MDSPFPHPEKLGHTVETQTGELERNGQVLLESILSTQDGLHAADEQVWNQGLYQTVVRSRFEAGYLVFLVENRLHGKDRSGTTPADIPYQLLLRGAVGEPQDAEIVPIAGSGGSRFGKIGLDIHHEIACAEILTEYNTQVAVAQSQKNGGFHIQNQLIESRATKYVPTGGSEKNGKLLLIPFFFRNFATGKIRM